GELAEIGRSFIETQGKRPLFGRAVRAWLVRVLPAPRQLAIWSRLGGLFRWVLPDYLSRAIPHIRRGKTAVVKNHTRCVVVLDGCVQRVTTPEVNEALGAVLDRAGVKVVRVNGEGCCGSLALHLGQHERSLAAIRASVELLYAAAAAVDAEAI